MPHSSHVLERTRRAFRSRSGNEREESGLWWFSDIHTCTPHFDFYCVTNPFSWCWLQHTYSIFILLCSMHIRTLVSRTYRALYTSLSRLLHLEKYSPRSHNPKKHAISRYTIFNGFFLQQKTWFMRKRYETFFFCGSIYSTWFFFQSRKVSAP